MRNPFFTKREGAGETSSKADHVTHPAAFQNGGGDPLGSRQEKVAGKMGVVCWVVPA